MNEIQRSMREDIRNMKRIGNNIKHMKGKRGIVGTMYDTNRGLTEKQIKKKYETGEVKVYNMEKILHKDEFKYLADDIKKLYIETWRQKYSMQEIAKQMDIGYSTLYSMSKRLGVTDGNKGKIIKATGDKVNVVRTGGGQIGMVQPKKDTEKTVVATPVQEQKVETTVATVPTVSTVPTVPTETVKTAINLNETLEGTKLASRLYALAILVNDSEEYTVNLSITQK